MLIPQPRLCARLDFDTPQSDGRISNVDRRNRGVVRLDRERFLDSPLHEILLSIAASGTGGLFEKT